MDHISYEKRGYLHEDFRLFHLKDAMQEPMDWHYHTFHKIIVFLSGTACYGIEGKSYPLEAGDLVLVGKGCIHRPEVAPGAPYERVVIYISPEFLRQMSTPDCDLESCFVRAIAQFDFVVRPEGSRRDLLRLLQGLERAAGEKAFGSELLARALFLQLLITVTRGMGKRELQLVHTDACDEKVMAILQYLSVHLTQRISIDDLAAHFYVSKYHMMRRFKEQTGYTIHSYISTKRLMLAREKLREGASSTDACFACGFRDYSSFARAYKKLFSESPRSAR